jgi:hypothetical protein
MQRAEKNQYDAQGLARSVLLQEGLKRTFAACHEPLPTKMEQLLEELCRVELQQELS